MATLLQLSAALLYVMASLAMILALGGDAANSDSSLKQQVRQSLRDALDSKANDDAPWYMYISGTAPLCNGDCNDDGYQSTVLRPISMPSLHFEFTKKNYDRRVASWSGNTESFGKDCTYGSKAICVTQKTNGRTQTPWEFPMCGGNPNNASSEYCTRCTGCPNGTVDVGEWTDTSGAVCCIADGLYTLDNNSGNGWNRQAYCNKLGTVSYVWSARRCKFDASKL